ncbi:ACT domain-containing protein [Tautonia plasticadhaerens]|uniref:Uncharacterized protein n=1 Tax=Tautonia plasticadhaerens TaxID=2527974 RepID=A0A518HAX9_9BACT|nr:ACT domain-containing protein [Tautonia plasticadhaerens]QDV38018.1 hypothetical protein ElP_59660 [Tautonia plasticadhaerens]
MSARPLVLDLLPGSFAVSRLDPGAAVPGWADRPGSPLSSRTRTADELSVVCPADLVPEGVRAERGWRAFRVEGPLPFALTGVLASIAGPLADAGVNLFVVSTFDTDYVLVPGRLLDRAAAALEAEGHAVRRPAGS